jgi:hypothetical protein
MALSLHLHGDDIETVLGKEGGDVSNNPHSIPEKHVQFHICAHLFQLIPNGDYSLSPLFKRGAGGIS